MRIFHCKVLESAFACVVSENQTLLGTIKVKEHEVAHSNQFDRLEGKLRTGLEEAISELISPSVSKRGRVQFFFSQQFTFP